MEECQLLSKKKDTKLSPCLWSTQTYQMKLSSNRHPAGTCALLFTIQSREPASQHLCCCCCCCFCVHKLALLWMMFVNDDPVSSQFKSPLLQRQALGRCSDRGSCGGWRGGEGNFCSIRGSLAPPCGEATNLLSSIYRRKKIELNLWNCFQSGCVPLSTGRGIGGLILGLMQISEQFLLCCDFTHLKDVLNMQNS